MFTNDSQKIEQDKEMDRLLILEKHCSMSLEKAKDDRTQRELLSVLDSLQRQKKQLSEQMYGTV